MRFMLFIHPGVSPSTEENLIPERAGATPKAGGGAPGLKSTWTRSKPEASGDSTGGRLNAGGGLFKPVAMRPNKVEDAAPEFKSRVQIVSPPADQNLISDCSRFLQLTQRQHPYPDERDWSRVLVTFL